MIDWHSHILPTIDDGSRDVYESVAMLNELKRQGIEYVIATPHFLAETESVDSFLERRAAALNALSVRLNDSHPTVLCGAEVKYYPGISRMKELSRLTVEGTSILLLEMPASKWSEYTVRELEELSLASGLTIILAHVERCLFMQDKNTISRLSADGILMQTNAGCLARYFVRRKIFRLMEEGKLHFIGSDCHNMSSRPPRMNEAYDRVRIKFGEEFLDNLHRFGCSLIKNKIARA